MKKSLVIIGTTAALLFITAVALPVIFKGRIQKAVDRSINEAVRANVSYGELSLSLLKGFPNLSLSIEQISVVGIGQFNGDTLVVADKIAITVNPIKAIFSDKVTINRIALVRPRLLVRILEDGTANYDITIENDSENSAESAYQLGVNKWTIEEGSLIITDQQTDLFMDMRQINHEGSGDFSQDLFDLSTSSQFQLQNLSYQGIAYLSNKEILAEVTLEMNLPEAKYTFRENQVSINQFTFGFDGWVSMPEGKEDILMDISFATHQNEFRHLLSCVPGMYREGFDEINSSGLVTMNGKANGTYNSVKVPAFQFLLKVEDGMFQYPDLPTSVKNINFEMLVANEDGNPDHLLVDLNTLHLEFGQNPLDGSLRIDGLAVPEIKMNMTTSLDLAELTGMFPMDGTILKGTYDLSLNAEGTYDSAAQRFPIVEASMKLQDGFVKSAEFPESLEQFNLTSTVSNKTGHLPDTRIEIPDFSFMMDGEAFAGRLTLVNPHDYSWDLAVDGGVNLEKMIHILSLEEMALEGIVRGNLTTTGKISSLEAEKYEEIPTSGDFNIEAFSYTDSELSHPFQISSGRASFTPQQINLTNIKAVTGATDLKVNGRISNYINYVFQDHALISGALNIESDNVDLNEWMTDSPTADVVDSLAVLEVPFNIDFDLEVKASTVLYDNLTLRNVRGQVLIKEGVARMHDLSFNSLGGGFLVSGTYDPRDLAHPKFDLGIEMQEVAFKEAYSSFNIVKTLAPVAQLINGNFSTNLKINGELQPNMMPSLGTLSANGLVNIVSAALSANESKLMQGFAEVTQFQSGPAKFNLNDVVMAIKIKNGQMDVAPFAATFGDYQTMVSGSTGIDGTMNFTLNMEVPAGIVGTSVNQAIANLTGNDQPVNDKVNLNLNLSGSYTDPQFSIGGLQGGNTTAGQAKSAVSQKSEEVKDSVATVVNQQTQKLTETAQQQLDSIVAGSIKDSTSSEAIKSATKDLINKEQVEGVLDIFKKKKSKEEEN